MTTMREFLTVSLIVILALLPTVSFAAGRTKQEGTRPFQNQKTYTTWVEANHGKYARSEVLNSAAASSSVVLHWSIENESTSNAKIRLAVAVEAGGWLGFGISETGGMKGCDMFIFERRSNQVNDAYSVDFEMPKTNEQQDWKLISSTVDDDFIIVEVERMLVTNDSMDWPFTNDDLPMIPRTKVIAAWGKSEEMKYHGAADRLSGEVKFFGSAAASAEALARAEMEREAEGSVVITVKNIDIPFRKTSSYNYICFTEADLVRGQQLPPNATVHVIGFEFLVEHGEVHHMTLFHSPQRKLCHIEGASPMAMWARGQANTQLFPPGVGMILTSADSPVPRMFGLQVHYENPGKIRGIRDNSGLRVYFTSKLRDMNADLLELADPKLKMLGFPVGNGSISHRFTCPDTCTKNNVPAGGITVYREGIHMHKYGLSGHNIQKRGGKEIRRGSVEYFDVGEGSHVVKQEPFQVLPGDSFETICNYDSKAGLMFGAGSLEEMCVVVLYYYPATEIPLKCTVESEIESCRNHHTAVTSPDMERTFAVKRVDPRVATGIAKPHRGAGGLSKIFFIAAIGIMVLLWILWLRQGKVQKKYRYVKADTDELTDGESGSCMGLHHQTAVRRRTAQNVS